ncbi:MAG: tRNA uridine-5-carboxymethylaminomethyl(34) synthesis enzyme MnmG [Clostridia bacterium]|nr:tRNA uridine-5-carboxymethylaminomethyl(34) synthesis enzyme MnmG [Clostridia bacterium]
MKMYDVIVIGAGHAGVESAFAVARLQRQVLLSCTDIGTVSYMACNPAIGGTAKGHLVREIDALGGEMGLTADQSLVQIKMLNRAKGPAVFSLRGQQDKNLYHEIMLEKIQNTKGITLYEGEAVKIIVKDGKSTGVEFANGDIFECQAVVIASGVYLNGRIITGEYTLSSGPSGYSPATKLTDNLVELGLPMRRFKTGTPARIYRDSIDFDKMEIQLGENADRFSFMSKTSTFEEEPCYLTYTNEETHKIILDNIHRSPLYNGSISGVGPRYCPSIEDKVVRFKDKSRHQIFVEPEGLHSDEMYIQGMSSSLPHDVQEKMYRTLPGLENCRFAKYAYAIEYDCIDPLALKPSLESKTIENLFSAGQINGSSGYEEAGAQGLMAGVNAVRKIEGKDPFILRRDQAYIGVLIDDLVTKGTNEPYRMMTARAEHRIKLRQDNADMRLTELGYKLGIVSEERYKAFTAKKEMMAQILKEAEKTVPKDISDQILTKWDEPIARKTPTLYEMMKRPNAQLEDVKTLLGFEVDDEALNSVIIECRYSGYLEKEEGIVREQKRLEDKLLPEDIDYSSIRALRIEARQKLDKVRPLNLGQASRISGVSPADIAVLIVYLQKYGK